MTEPSPGGRVLWLLSIAKGPKGQMTIRRTIIGIPVFAAGEVRPEVRAVAMRH